MSLHFPAVTTVEAALAQVQAAIPVVEGFANFLPEPEHATVETALKVAAEVLAAVEAALHEIP